MTPSKFSLVLLLFQWSGAIAAVSGSFVMSQAKPWSKWAWPLWILSNAALGIFSYFIGAWGLVAQQIVFLGININGYRHWWFGKQSKLAPSRVPDDVLFADLKALELELQQSSSIRNNRVKLAAVLHDDYQEFGRSGISYNKPDAITLLLAEADNGGAVSDRFAMTRLADDSALLTYRSARIHPDGGLIQFTLRSSVWRLTQVGWQIAFHQGTPAPSPASPGAGSAPGRIQGSFFGVSGHP
jgi:hypothetical protein